MKKITLLLMSFILSLGFISAQTAATLNFTLEATHDSQDNNRVSIPTLSKDAVWKITATTLYMGEPSGSWGSRLFSAEREGVGEYSGFEFYLRPEDHSNNPGKLGLNNKYDFGDEAISIDHSEGTLFTFEITCEGDGLITGTVKVNDHEWTKTRDDIEYLEYVQAAQNYDVEVNIEYYPPYLSVTPATWDFGSLNLNESSDGKEISIYGSADYSDTFSFSITGEEGNVDNFYVLDAEFSPATGNKLTVYFDPRIEVYGPHKAILKIQRGEETAEVELLANLSPQTPIDTDAWYRIQFDKRTTFLLAGNTVGEPAETTIYDKNDNSQLWKFSATSEEGKYKLVNKEGNGLEYRYEEVDPETEDVIVTGRFLIANGENNNTYSFSLRKDGGWQIKWNEWEGEDSEGNPIFGSYINKTGSDANDSQFTQYNVIPDPGSSVLFHKENVVIDHGLPEFSTASNPIWYYIQFKRTAETVDYKNARFQSVGEGENVLQTEFNEEEKETFYFRFEGTWNDFKIFDYEGLAFGTTTKGGLTPSVAADEATNFKFRIYGTTSNWEIQDLQSEFFLNDNGKTAVGEWTSDGGCPLIIFKVDNSSGVEDVIADDEEILNSVYYTVQGIQLNTIPSQTGLYIRKDTYVSGKTSAKTIFIRK